MVNNAADFKCIRKITHKHSDAPRKKELCGNNRICCAGSVLKYKTFLGSGCLQNANKPPELLKDKLNGKRKWGDI